MPTILAIETSSELASAAVLCGERVLARESSGVQSHSYALLPMVHGVLADAGISLAQCDAIAFGCGPGSFTGVRTACGVAQGLAFGQDLPVLPVVTLLAMAQACRAASGANDVLAVLDARMGEVYWAQYRYTDGWQIVTQPTLSAPRQVLAQGAPLACGNGLLAYADAFAAAPFTGGGLADAMPRAEYVAQLGRIAYASGAGLAPRDAQPLYLRNKVALTTTERLAKSGVIA
jgi:tRNA threonylcarbamoyladenosine biosynthesis protein TsaB